MAKTFHLTIARVGENLFDGEALSVTVPGAEGVMTVLAGHEAFVSPIKAGTIRIEDAAGVKSEVVVERNGVIEVSGNQATVIL